MFRHNLRRLILVVTTFSAISAWTHADDSNEMKDLRSIEGVESVEVLKDLDLIILHLHNDMTVCLKSTEDEDEEVVVRLAALGGFSALPSSQRASGQLAPRISLKSGLGDYNFDQLQALLYQHSIEFSSTIQPFCRTVDASACPEEVDTLLSLVHSFFTQRRFSKDSYDRVVAKAKYNFTRRSKEGYNKFEETFLTFNTQNFSPLQSLSLSDIEHADFDNAKHFLDRCFNNPSDFVCLIVGRFDVETLSPLIAKHLASIPKKGDPFTYEVSDLPEMNRNAKTKIIKNYNDSTESITRLTFPVKIIITEDNMNSVEAIAKLVEMRLNKAISAHLQLEQVSINASLEFPLYPSLKSPWLTIQYISDPTQVKHIEKIIVSELEQLQNTGVSKEEVALVKQNTQERERWRQKDNNYWIMVLSNYYLWGWDLKGIQKNSGAVTSFKAADFTNHIRSCLSLKHYTIVSAQP